MSMSNEMKHAAHMVCHLASHTETGRQITKAIAGTALTAATVVLGPAVVAAAAPVAAVAAVGYGIWSLLTD